MGDAPYSTQPRNHLPWKPILLLCMPCILLFWLYSVSTEGKRACRKWFETGEPNLTGVTIRVIKPGAGCVATCSDREALAYFSRCRLGAEDWLWGDRATDVRLGAECSVTFRFEGGATYRLASPAMVNRVGIALSIPGEVALEPGWGTTVIPFIEPREPKWDAFLSRLGANVPVRRPG
jgi:hypothetical protein